MMDEVSIAKKIQQKYSLFAEYQKMIGVDEGVANIDAEGI